MKLCTLLQFDRSGISEGLPEKAAWDELRVNSLVSAADDVYEFVHIPLRSERLFFPDSGILLLPLVGAGTHAGRDCGASDHVAQLFVRRSSRFALSLWSADALLFTGELHRHLLRISPVNFTEYPRVLMPVNTAYSPESNGMAECFVKGFKRDYVYVNRLESAESVMRQLAAWFDDYNDVRPHQALKWKSPREYRNETSTA